jgi:hypothetical protein
MKPALTDKLYEELIGDTDELQAAASSMTRAQHFSILRSNRDMNESVYEIRITHAFPPVPPGVQVADIQESSYWLIGYNSEKGLIDFVMFRRRVPFETPASEQFYPTNLTQDGVTNGFRILGLPPHANNSVLFLFATARREVNLRFTDEYSKVMTFGAAKVHVPDDHKMGKL